MVIGVKNCVLEIGRGALATCLRVLID